MKIRVIYLLLLILVLLHLPFLSADPDKNVDVHTRGAWTDEGLYAAQVRNFVNYGDFGLKENTTFVRGPLFDLMRVPIFFVFGTRLEVARVITLLVLLLGIIVLSQTKGNRPFVVFFALILLIHPRVFHFSHYAMAEMLSVSMVLISYHFLLKYFETNRKKHLFLAGMMIFFAWGLKIQFLYLIILLPFAILIFDLLRLIRKEISRKTFLTDFGRISVFSAGFPVIYLLLWYLPNRGFYNRVMFEQTSRRFDLWEKLYQTIDFNFTALVLDPANLVLAIGFAGALTFLIYSSMQPEFQFRNLLVIVFGGTWVIIELHKMGMTYLPQRYLLSFFAAVGFFTAAVLYQVFDLKSKFKYLLLVFLPGAVVLSGVFYVDSLSNRTWELQRVNHYLKGYDWDGQTMAGVWAPSVSWGTKARVIPVWKGYHDPTTFFDTLAPRMVVEEPDEGTSEEFFRSSGIDLHMMSDSVRYFHVWRYGLELFWVAPENRTSGRGPD